MHVKWMLPPNDIRMQRKTLALLLFLVVGLLAVYLIGHQRDRHSSDGHFLPPDTAQLTTATPVVHIYMENSGSMDGYLTTNSQFKNALGHLIAKANGFYENTRLDFINTQVHHTAICDDLDNFVLHLNPATMKVGQTGHTDLNQIFRLILDRTEGDTVSVLVSDCIYDVDNVNTLLSAAASSTTGAFMKAMKRAQEKGHDFGVIIMQLESTFYGNHYEGNTPMPYFGKRPYYMIVMGQQEQLAHFNAHMELENTSTGLPGLKHKFMMSSQPTWDLDPMTARTFTSTFTNARRIQPEHNGLDIHNLTTNQEQPTLSFAVALGVEHLFTDRAYLLDSANYQVLPSQYHLKAVTDKPHFTECDFFRRPICLQLVTDSNAQYAPEITILLKNNIPAWVKECSYNEHLKWYPQPHQSFALYEMVEGIFGAFHNVKAGNDDDIFRLKIHVAHYD